jgi:hypothetical protein
MACVARTAIFALAMSGFVVTFAKADDSVRSFPPDTTHYSRPLVPEDLGPLNTGNGPPSLARRPGWRKPSTSLIHKSDLSKLEGERSTR